MTNEQNKDNMAGASEGRPLMVNSTRDGRDSMSPGKHEQMTGQGNEGSTPSPGLSTKKKQGRPRKAKGKDRPACERWIQGFEPHIEIPYPNVTPDWGNYGLYLFKKDYTNLGLVRYQIGEKNLPQWKARKTQGGPRGYTYHYDLIEINVILIQQLISALTEALKWFGGTEEIKNIRVERLEMKKANSLDDKFKRLGGVL